MFKYKNVFRTTFNNCVWHKRGTGVKRNQVLYEIFDDEGPVACINIPEYGKSETIVAIKDYSENTGMMEFLAKHGLVKCIVGHRYSGFACIPIVELDIDKMEEMNRADYGTTAEPKDVRIIRALPHGSGINGDWEIRIAKDRVTCRNVYDHMCEEGLYDICIDFSVTFRKDGRVNVRFHQLSPDGRYTVKEDGLREYLADTLAECYDDVAEIMEW